MFGIAAIGTGIERASGRWDRREDERSMTGVHLAKLEDKFISIKIWGKIHFNLG